MSTSRKFTKLETADGRIVNSLSLNPRICKPCNPNNAWGEKNENIRALKLQMHVVRAKFV